MTPATEAAREAREALAAKCLADHGRAEYGNPNVIRAMLAFADTEAASQPREGDMRRALEKVRKYLEDKSWDAFDTREDTLIAVIDEALTQRPPEQAGTVPAGWQPIETAPRDGTTFIGRNADHHSFGSWPMQRRVRHVFEGGEAKCLDGGGWLIISDQEPDFDSGLESMVQAHVPFSIATDDLNKTVRYEWRPLPSAAPTPPDAGPGEIPAGMVLMPSVATREMVDAADACTDAYEAYGKMVEVGRVR